MCRFVNLAYGNKKCTEDMYASFQQHGNFDEAFRIVDCFANGTADCELSKHVQVRSCCDFELAARRLVLIHTRTASLSCRHATNVSHVLSLLARINSNKPRPISRLTVNAKRSRKNVEVISSAFRLAISLVKQ